MLAGFCLGVQNLGNVQPPRRGRLGEQGPGGVVWRRGTSPHPPTVTLGQGVTQPGGTQRPQDKASSQQRPYSCFSLMSQAKRIGVVFFEIAPLDTLSHQSPQERVQVFLFCNLFSFCLFVGLWVLMVCSLQHFLKFLFQKCPLFHFVSSQPPV